VSALARLGLLRPLAATLVIAACCVGYQAWLTAGGARKLGDDEVATGPRGNYEVVVEFLPEAFHVTRMQAIGRVIEVRGASVFLMDAGRDDIRELARAYWIADVKPWVGR